MRRVMCVFVLLALAGSAYAELQSVVVGGELRIRGRWWRNAYAAAPVSRMPIGAFGRRPIGPFGVASQYDWDNRGGDLKFVEQRTLLNVRADFTDKVSAFIELEDYERWGQDFRSNYITGVDTRANSIDDIEVFQAYIDVNDLFGQPLRLRIGRQELTMGKSWLIGSRVSPCLGISYDGLRLTYAKDDLSIDAWWSKLAENGTGEEDGDVDYYGVYATYSGIKPLSLSAYWTYIRDARAVTDMNLGWGANRLEHCLGLDDYDVTNFHTVGVRAFGKYEALDYDLELAYQFGNADATGALFPEVSFWGAYGDDRAKYDAWAGDLEVGYTFDATCKPRIFVGGAYFEGEDNRHLNFWEWVNPFDRSDASISFNRLFSGVWYSSIMDIVGGASDLSNFWQARAGISANPTEAVSTGLILQYYGIVKPFDWPEYVTLPTVGHYPPLRFPIAPALGFWTDKASDDIGVLTHVWMKYTYSPDLWIKIGWEHLFTGDGLAEGSFTRNNGLRIDAGTAKDDADYIYFDTQLKF